MIKSGIGLCLGAAVIGAAITSCLFGEGLFDRPSSESMYNPEYNSRDKPFGFSEGDIETIKMAYSGERLINNQGVYEEFVGSGQDK